jgi:hypothetical protein
MPAPEPLPRPRAYGRSGGPPEVVREQHGAGRRRFSQPAGPTGQRPRRRRGRLDLRQLSQRARAAVSLSRRCARFSPVGSISPQRVRVTMLLRIDEGQRGPSPSLSQHPLPPAPGGRAGGLRDVTVAPPATPADLRHGASVVPSHGLCTHLRPRCLEHVLVTWRRSLSRGTSSIVAFGLR